MGAPEVLIERLNRLPGIGPKSAERLAFHLLAAVFCSALLGHVADQHAETADALFVEDFLIVKDAKKTAPYLD